MNPATHPMVTPHSPSPQLKPTMTVKEALEFIASAQKAPLATPRSVLRAVVLARRARLELKGHPATIEAAANALHDLGFYKQAAKQYERIVSAFPASSRAHFNVGRSLLPAQQLNAANDWFACTELLEPDYAQMHLGLGFIQLATQNYALGWEKYEHRLRADGFMPREVKNVTLWAGQVEHPIEGKTIFVANEQGLGDTLMFFRYVIALAQLGAIITVLVQPRLHLWVTNAVRALGVTGSKGGKIVAVVSDGDPVQKTDYWCPMPSLPAKLGVKKMLPPALLPVTAGALPQARQGLLKVGLAWSGEAANKRNTQRSFEFKHIVALLGTPNVQFFNLQMGEPLEAAKKHPLWQNVIDLTPLQRSFHDTAQHIAALDLVLTVDTSILHAAGALNKPFWALLDAGAEWRNGMPNLAEHPFYPKGRLYRAPRRGFKATTVARMARDLAKFASDFARNAVTHPPNQSPSAPAIKPLHSGRWLAVLNAKHGVFAINRHDTFVGRSLALYGQVLEGELALCTDLMPRSASVIEVGAGMGAHTVALAKHLSQGGRVHSFEAQSSQIALLQTNLTLNELSNVNAHCAVVGAQAGTVRVPEFDPMTARNCGGVSLATPSALGQQVQAMALDSMAIESLNWVKIDAFGMELDVLLGAAQQLKRFSPWIYLCNPARNAAAAGAAQAAALDVNWLPYVFSLAYRVYAHRVALYEEKNFSANAVNVFDRKVSTNFLAVPIGVQLSPGLMAQHGLIEMKR